MSRWHNKKKTVWEPKKKIRVRVLRKNIYSNDKYKDLVPTFLFIFDAVCSGGNGEYEVFRNGKKINKKYRIEIFISLFLLQWFYVNNAEFKKEKKKKLSAKDLFIIWGLAFDENAKDSVKYIKNHLRYSEIGDPHEFYLQYISGKDYTSLEHISIKHYFEGISLPLFKECLYKVIGKMDDKMDPNIEQILYAPETLEYDRVSPLLFGGLYNFVRCLKIKQKFKDALESSNNRLNINKKYRDDSAFDFVDYAYYKYHSFVDGGDVAGEKKGWIIDGVEITEEDLFCERMSKAFSQKDFISVLELEYKEEFNEVLSKYFVGVGIMDGADVTYKFVENNINY